MTYDVIVVGGGAAGCVLSARLSESRSRRVLLLEAGPDLRAAMPADIRSGWRPAFSFDWRFASVPDEEDHNRPWAVGAGRAPVNTDVEAVGLSSRAWSPAELD